MSDYQPRQVVLSSGKARGFGGREMGSTLAMSALLGAAAVIVALSGALWSFVVGAVLVFTAVALFTPADFFGGRTGFALLVRAVRWRHRVRTGLATLVPGEPARSAKGKARSGVRVVPDWVGPVRVVDVDVAAAGGTGQVCVLIHRPVDDTAYATVVLEVENAGGGVQSPADTDAEHARFGRAKARLARQESLVRVIQQIERVQPATAARHEQWLGQVVPEGVPESLVQSYDNLLTHLTWNAETHHTLLVLRMPFTPAWSARVIERYGASNDYTNAQMAVLEASDAAGVMVSTGGYRNCHPLSQAELGAAIRACFSDAYSWDDTSLAGPDDRDIDLQSCWLAYSADATTVHVADGRELRTAEVVGSRIGAEPVPVTMLRDLVVGIYPAMVRTISIVEELIPAGQARTKAKSEATSGMASATRSGPVHDGSAEERLTSAQVTLRDLRPSSGHHGVSWTAHVTVSGASVAELNRACARLEGVCADIGLPIRWMAKEQDLALATTLPLARGLKMTTRTWKMR